MGVAERYAKKKISGEKDKVYNGVEYRHMVNSGIADEIANRVNVWFQNNNNYITNFQDRYANRTGSYKDSYVSDSSEWLSTITTQKNNFDKEAEGIKSAIEQYKGFLDSSWADSVIKALDEGRRYQDDILKHSTEDNTYWSQWDSGVDYFKYQTYEQEKDKKRKLDVTTAQKEIESLQNQYNEITRLQSELRRAERDYDSAQWQDQRDIAKQEIAEYTAKLKQYGNVDVDAIGKTISEKSLFMNQAKYLQKSEEMKKVKDEADFDLYAQKGLSWNEGKSILSSDRNEVVDARNNTGGVSINGVSPRKSLLQALTDEEAKVYSYYLAKYGKDKAEEYLEYIEADVNERKAVANYEVLQGNTALEYMFGVGAGLDQFFSGVVALLDDRDYIPPSAIQQTSGMVREDLADKGFNVLGSSLGQAGYDLITTTTNMLPSILVSTGLAAINPALGAVAGNVTLGASAAGNAYSEMLNLGYSKGQARMYATMVGGAEAGLQYLIGGISKLGGGVTSNLINKALSSVDNAFARGALQLGGSMLSEGFEEGMQEILEPWFKSLVDKGTDFEAPDIDSVLYSSLLGALSAGLLEGVGGTVETVKKGAEVKGIEGGVDRLKNLGSTMSPESVAYKIANKVNEKTGAYTIGTLLNEMGAAMTDKNIIEVEQALMDKGMNTSDAKTVSKWLAASVDGHTFTKKQIAALENNPIISSVFREVIIDQNSTVNQRSQQYSDIFAVADEVANGGEKEPEAEVPETEAPEVEEPDAEKRGSHAPFLFTKEWREKQGLKSATSQSVSDSEYSSSADGKTILATTGEEVSIKEVASVKNGEMTLKLDNGKTVSAKDVSYSSSSEALVYEAVADMGVNPVTATSLIKGYDGKMSAKAYVLGIKEAYTYGKYNYPASEMSEKSFSAVLSETQRSTAYKLGQIDEKARVTTAQEKLKSTIRENQTVRSKGGKLHYDGISKGSRSKLQRTSLKALEKVAEALGVDIHLYESTVNEKGKRGYTMKDGRFTTANGWYDPADGSIHIDINAGASGRGTMLFTAAHELTHYIRAWSPEKFKVLADFLMEQYGEKGVSVSSLVQAQINKAKNNGRTISYDVAYEEVVADSMEMMLADGDVASKLAELKAKDKGLWEKIKEFITDLCAKIKEAYSKLVPDSAEGKYVKEMADSMEQLKNLFTEALLDASATHQEWIGTRDINEFSEAKGTDGENLFQYRAMEADKEAYRAMLIKHGLMSDTEIDNLFDMIDDAVDIIKNNLEALDYAWDVDINDRAFMPVKPNSDKLYEVSLDFSTLCRKRLLQQTIQTTLQAALNKQLSKEEAIAIRDELMKIQEEGRQIEIACALCYVESARMKSPTQIKKFLKNREAIIKDFFAGRAGGSMKEKIKQAEVDAREKLHKENPEGIKGKDGSILDPREASLKAMPKKYADEIRQAKKEAKLAYQPTEHEQKMIDAAMTMTAADFTSPEGLENLAKNYRDLFDAYTSFVRNATKSKGIEKDTWWRAGDSDSLIGQTLIDKMNAENGLRSQSWSDFQVIHLLDYIAATIELSTKNTKRQSYTKVPDYVKLLGNTGDMINMSLIPARVYKGKLEYDPVEGMAYDVALKLREKYHATAGTICIGIENNQIKALLADATIDYVIPYHKSGMSAATRKLMHIPEWFDYEKYQSESELSDEKARNNAEKYGVKLLAKTDSKYHVHTNFSEWFDLEEARQIAKVENAHPSDAEAQKKYGVMYGAYKAMQSMADNYIKLCAERGLTPKFSHPEADFTQEENFWKLLIDRKMIDNVTGEIIEQKAIKPIFDKGDVLDILNDELKRYPEIKKDQEYATRKVVQKFLSGEMKVDKDTLEAIKKPVDNITKVNILASAEEIKDFDYSKERIAQNIQYIAKMHSVYDVDKSKLERTGKRTSDIYDEYFKEWGYHIYSDELGDISVATSSRRSEIRHGNTAPKIASIEAIPTVVKEGKVIFASFKPNGNVQRIVVCAPIKIGDTPYYMGVMLQRDNQSQRLYLHDVAIEKEASSITQADLITTGADEIEDNLFTTIILQKALSVKYQNEKSLLSDRESENLYSDRVTDKETLEFLENQEHVTVYRAMQVIDGKLYPPMNAYTYDKNGKKVLMPHSEIGAWEQSVERPDLIDPKTGKFKLDKGKVDSGKRGTAVPAAYNPYIHTSLSMLNDQFTSAYQRSNLVVVKGSVPKSELTSGYRAQYAKDSVGETEWHSGVVSTQLPESRKVILSRWFKPVEILDNDVVAQNIKEMLGNTGIEIPYNVVSPKLRRSLEKIGVPIGEGRGIKNLPPKNEVKYSDRESYAPTFYSHMGKVVDGIKTEKVGANGVIPYLKGKGVKDEEIKWSGIAEWLQGKKSVTKAELQEFIAGSQLEIVEEAISDTKWNQYKLEGGENYRELVFKIPDSTYSNRAMRGHWGEDAEGVLVHARIQDFETPDGKSMLFVEEIQSDWHNEGHREGYSTQEYQNAVESKDKLYNEYKKLDLAYHKYVRSNEFMTDPDDVRKKKHDWLRNKAEAAYEKYLKAKTVVDSLKKEGVGDTPDAPFRNNYHEYVMKRLLRMAVEEGYDSIGWTPADIQSERWSDDYAEGYHIEYDQDIPSFLKKYGKKWGAKVSKTELDIESDDFTYVDDNGNEFELIKQWYDSVMDSYAEKDQSVWNDFVSNRFKIAEEGLTLRIEHKQTGKQLDEVLTMVFKPVSVWSMDITDAMRDSVLYEGQPLYQEREADTSDRAILANAFENVAKNDIEKRKIAEYREKISLIEEEQKKLAETRAKIKEISFSKGKRDEKLLKSLKFDAVQAANRINTYDKQLLKLEASKPLADVLSREKYKVKRRMEQKAREAVAEQRKIDRERMEQKLADASARYQASRQRATENRHRTEMRHKIKNVVSELNKLLLNGSKEHNVKINLQKATADALLAVNMDTVNADERLAKIQSQIDKEMAKEAPDMDKVNKLKASFNNIEAMGEKMTARLTALKDAYEQIKDSDDPLIANSYDDAIKERISNLRENVGDTPLRDMTLEQLEDVYDTYKMVLTTIRNANKAFVANKKLSIAQLGEDAMREVYQTGGYHYKHLAATEWFKKQGWNVLKPVYAFRTIGSDTMTDLYKEVRRGEDTWYGDMQEAKDFRVSVNKKYNFKSWDFNKSHEFTAKSGNSFDLTLEQIMAIYAYSRRDQAIDHLLKGGIVFDNAIEVTEKVKGVPVKFRVNTASAFNLSEQTLNDIINTLTPEQKAYVEEMQGYLTDTMGEKGNEVSLKMYGIKLFKEKIYFPLRSAKQFMFEENKPVGEARIKNSGFTKNVVKFANNPIILSNFSDVWASHVNEMSMYHAFVLPLEDFNRVYNYKTPTNEQYETLSLKQTLQNAYGRGVNEYISTLLTDLNGGARNQGGAEAINKLMSLTKKGAVFASASVAVQQPSAIPRAMALVNPKYFVTSVPESMNLKNHNRDWAELKKYAPIAGIKEMGYFDTGVGQSSNDWLKSEGYEGFRDKFKAFFTDGDFRDEILSKAPSFMDEIGWVQIWNAVKKETEATTGLAVGSEEFLKAAGERFTEVVSLTQVYDSVLSRSGMMRSKDTGMKMATAFMSEPTVQLNMLVDAAIQGKRKGKNGGVKVVASTFGAVLSSVVLNAVLKSIVTAGRDDDEDKTYFEKYIGAVIGDLTDSINPLTLVPFAKDIVSIFQGYDVTRMDMNLISDIYKAIDNLDSDNKTAYQKISGVATSLAALIGVPLKNIERDIRGVVNTIKSFASGQQTTVAGVGQAIKESVTGKADSNAKQLYDAVMSGNQTQIDRVKGRFKDEDAIETAIRKALRENDKRINEAAQARMDGDIERYKTLVREIVAEGHFKQDLVVGAVNAQINLLKEPEKDKEEASDEEKASSIYRGDDINASLENGDIDLAKEIIADLIETKVVNGMDENRAKSSVKSSITSYWKPLYKKAYSEKNDDEMKRIREILYASGIYGRKSDVLETVKKWLKED